MQRLELLPIKFDVSSLRDELINHPELWDDFDMRTNDPRSPHRDMSDIFLRYNSRDNYRGDRQEFNQEHESVWWGALNSLPSAKKIVFDLMRSVDGERLGMVLITRLPSGKKCLPHIDNGWHASYYDKYAVLISANKNQSFHVENESLSLMSGECFRFDNSKPHWVINDSSHDRITMIICIRNASTGVN